MAQPAAFQISPIRDMELKANALIGKSPTAGEHSQTIEETKNQMVMVFMTVMTSEMNIEEERLSLSENTQFYPESVFNYLKNFSHHLQQLKKEKEYQSFFDFSTPTDYMQYNQLNSYKAGFIGYHEILRLFECSGVTCTDKVLECIIKSYDSIGYTNGLCYEAFLKLLIPQSIPLARQKVLKRKVIYETAAASDMKGVLTDGQDRNYQSNNNNNNSSNVQVPPVSVLESIVAIFDLEISMLTTTENSRVKIQNNIEQNSLNTLFEEIDTEKKGSINYRSLQQFMKKSKSQMIPNQFLGLLRRLKKPENCETISLQDFKDFLSPNLPYFTANNHSQSIDNVQNYHSINKSLDISRTQNLNASHSNPQTARSNNYNSFSEQKNANLLAYTSRSPYENSDKKVYFKDKQGRIIEKNHPHEPAFIKEDPQLSEILKTNRNVVHHPQENTVYALVPEQYLEKPPLTFNTSQQQHHQQKTYKSANLSQPSIFMQYQMPRVDPKDLTGVDSFWWRSKDRTRPVLQMQQQPLISITPQQQSQPSATIEQHPPAMVIPQLESVTDPVAKRIIEQQQLIIAKQQEQISKINKAKPASAATAVNPINSMQPPIPASQQFQQMYATSPFVQDIVQLRHANTLSYGQVPQSNPLNPNIPLVQSQVVRNTNILQSQYNAKINPHNHNTELFNRMTPSQLILGPASTTNNAVTLQNYPIPIQQIPGIQQNTTRKSNQKQRIFDQNSLNSQLNDRNYHFQNVNSYYT